MTRVGELSEPVAELTRFGEVLMSPGKEVEINKLMCTKTSIDDYKNLWRLDILSLTDIARDDFAADEDFKDKFRRSKDGWYETGLMMKDNSTSLQNNKLRSLGWLKNLL